MVRALIKVRPVIESYVVRLVTEERAGGRLVGVVEAVASGERRPVRDADELLRVLLHPDRHTAAAQQTERPQDRPSAAAPAHTEDGHGQA